MGLTERHLFEFDDVPENYEWDLEDDLYNSVTNYKPIPAGEKITAIDNVINDLEIAKYVLASPLSLDMSMRIKIGQAITKAIELLKKEVSMKFIYEGKVVKEVEIDGRCDDRKCMFNAGAFCQRSPSNEFKCKLEKEQGNKNVSKNT